MCGQPSAQPATEPTPPGVVVFEVTDRSEAAKAGIKEGDVFVQWSAGASQGRIESPFDLHWVEMNFSTLGPVHLEGLRAGQEQQWTLARSAWGFRVRPQFSAEALALYAEGDALLKKRQFVPAIERWRKMLGILPSSPSSMRAWVLFYAADRMVGAGQRKLADSLYSEAVRAGELEKNTVAAELWKQWADVMYLRADWASAERYYRRALAWSQRASPENQLSATILLNLGYVKNSQNQPDMAERYYEQALAMQEKLDPESTQVAETLNFLGYRAYEQGNLVRAEKLFRRELEIETKHSPDSAGVAGAVQGLGWVAQDQGDAIQAQSYFQQAFEIIRRDSPESVELSYVFGELANASVQLGDFGRAQELLNQALAIDEKLAHNEDHTAWTLEVMSGVAFARGDMTGSERYIRRALKLHQQVAPGSVPLATDYGILGKIAIHEGDWSRARLYVLRAVAIFGQRNSGVPEFAKLLQGLAEIERQSGNWAKAETYLRRALTIREKIAPSAGQTAQILGELGDVLRLQGKSAQAEEYFRRSLAIRTEDTYDTEGYVQALASLAAILRDRRQLKEATQLYQQAENILEHEVVKLGGTEQDHATYRAHYASFYSGYIDLLMAQNRTESAYQVVERSRARALLETLATARVDIRQGADPALISKERSLQADITAKEQRHIRLLNEKRDQEQVRAIEKEISDLTSQYREVETRLRADSPAYAGLTQPQPLNAKEIQDQLLDDHTLLLEYALGEDRSFVFVLAPDSLQAFELPRRSQIERSARSVYRLLTERNRRVAGEREAQREQRWKRAETSFSGAVTALSRMVLGPVSSQLRDKRLLVVTDGALAYIPFSMLPEPSVAGAGGKSGDPLILHHEIVNLPSASVLALLRQQERSRQSPPKAVAVLADPVFDKADARIHSGRRPQTPGMGIGGTKQSLSGEQTDSLLSSATLLSRSAGDVGLLRRGGPFLPRLRFSRQEADAIMEATPTGSGLKLVDFDASRAAAMNPDLSQYRIVHFATHGLLDSVHPELSGLVLSLLDENGRAQDGFLGLQDIYNMNLPADLVVLSACKTGLGKEMNGEGLIGLTRGFMYAGASRVAASLWNVSDVATARLMADFYKAMEQDGLTPAAALRAAQIQMLKQTRWKSPYFWAAFEIQGDWN
jgi:CHAT domain-containing protein/Tfp pilus assembly protein PilF